LLHRAVVAEFLRRLVVQRTRRPHRIVFTSKQLFFLLVVRYALELFPLQELIAASTMKRLRLTVLPGASGRHLDRLGSLLRQPLLQRLADELRTIVAPDSLGRPSPPYHPCQDPSHVCPTYHPIDVQRQALPRVFVHQRQPLERTSVHRPIGDEVVRPPVVLDPRRLLDAAVGTRP